MSKARDGANTLLTIGTDLAAKAPLASPVFTGSVGVGVTPETGWQSYQAIRLGGVASVWSSTAKAANGHTQFGNNVYRDSSGNDKYIVTDEASKYRQGAGGHHFSVAASGSADAAVSFSTSLNLTNDGRGLSAFTAKAWVNLNGTGTPAIRSSHNISSVTDNGTGDYIPVFAVAMSNANYAAVANGGAVNNWRGTETTVITVSTANFRIYHVEDSSTYDPDFITAIVFGI